MERQTVVEWLENNLIGNPFSEKDFAHNINVFKEAKEMEKKQRIEDYNAGHDDGLCNHINDAENYINEYKYLKDEDTTH
jgi:hypothetical protein